jgi:hypothetical protein
MNKNSLFVAVLNGHFHSIGKQVIYMPEANFQAEPLSPHNSSLVSIVLVVA